MRILPMLTGALLLPLLPVLGGCEESSDPADIREVLPDDRLLGDPLDESTLARSRVDAPSRYALLTLTWVVETNAPIAVVLSLLDTITGFPASWTDETQTRLLWGPWSGDGVQGHLIVEHRSDGGFDWLVQMAAADAGAAVLDEAWRPVVAGEIDTGATATASTGRFWIDLDALNDLGQGDGTRGAVGVDYGLRPSGASTEVFLGDIAQGAAIPTDAATRFEHVRGGGGTMDVAVRADLTNPPNGTQELWVVRSRWTATGAGRADAFLTEGDLGPLTFTETECWSRGLQVVYFQNNYELASGGEEAACAFEEPSFQD